MYYFNLSKIAIAKNIKTIPITIRKILIISERLNPVLAELVVETVAEEVFEFLFVLVLVFCA